MKIYLVRHAQGGDIKINYDTLSELGKQQAKKLVDFFNYQNLQFDCFITGTLNRHKETLNIILHDLNQSHKDTIFHFENLNEISEELLKKLITFFIEKDEEVRVLFQKYYQNHLRKLYIILLEKIFRLWIQEEIHNEEISFSNFKKRVLDFFEIFNEITKNNKFKNILIISSGTPISLLTGSILGFSDRDSLLLMKQIKNTSFSIFEIHNHYNWEALELHQCPHLKKEEATLI